MSLGLDLLCYELRRRPSRESSSDENVHRFQSHYRCGLKPVVRAQIYEDFKKTSIPEAYVKHRVLETREALKSVGRER